MASLRRLRCSTVKEERKLAWFDLGTKRPGPGRFFDPARQPSAARSRVACPVEDGDSRRGLVLAGCLIDFRKVRDVLDKIDYSGWIHIEAATPHGAAADYAADYRYLRGIFPERATR